MFDHPWMSGLFADPEIAVLWSADTQLAHMLAFEAAWSRAGHLAGLWQQADGAAAADAISATKIDIAGLAQATARDGLCVPEMVRQLKAATGLAAIHTGTTSQDVMDTATVMSIRATLDVLVSRIGQVQTDLGRLDAKFGEATMAGRTRMQLALGITVRDRLQSWQSPMEDHLARIKDLRPRVLRVQIGGAAGDRAALGAGDASMVAAVAHELGLAPTPKAWHAMRDGIVEFASLLSLISGSLGKIGQDISLMAQQGIDDITVAGGGGSSAMPHKQNPILAELLVTLARFNAVQVSGLHQAMIHEQERSGAAWALEWMILPQMVQATGRALTATSQLTAAITQMGR